MKIKEKENLIDETDVDAAGNTQENTEAGDQFIEISYRQRTGLQIKREQRSAAASAMWTQNTFTGHLR